MKRILLLIPALNAGGAERVMVTLANEWSKEHEITLMVFNEGNCFYHLNREVHLKAMNIQTPQLIIYDSFDYLISLLLQFQGK